MVSGSPIAHPTAHLWRDLPRIHICLAGTVTTPAVAGPEGQGKNAHDPLVTIASLMTGLRGDLSTGK